MYLPNFFPKILSMTSAPLITLSYISRSTQNMGMLALMRLIDKAVKENKKMGLTGVLFYENQHFLDGLPENDVELLKLMRSAGIKD